ncbi:STAS/SEC14 domain-containing protein [Bernardetia sp. OM2101]|uniref:STAS/SEC14 domain-containing protein n=1 Tax=Bernardetia sp. OM2101 TaxID=3344876 RepID=UPI0035D03AF7
MNLLYQSADNCANSYINNESNYYLIRLQKKVSEQEYKAAYSSILEEYKTNPYTKLILSVVDNDSDPISVPFSARSWFASYFAPKFYVATNKNAMVAIVKPQTKFQSNMINVIVGVIEKADIKVKIEYFESEEEAIKWIKNIG